MKITICGSLSFAKEMIEAGEELNAMGHEAIVPNSAQIALTNPGVNMDLDYCLENNVLLEHYNFVADSDAILVINEEKNGIKGYIGASTLMEMAIARYFNKKIFLINPWPKIEELRHSMEIQLTRPIVLNRDLTKINTMTVAVGSHNPVKLEAVEMAFKTVWPGKEWDVAGVDVCSGVSDQPMSDEDGINGARNRAKQAIENTQSDYGVGLEGAIQKIGENYFDCGWIVVVDREGNEGIGSTIRMAVSMKMIEMIEQGMELGTVNDVLFKKTNSKQDQGHFGLMTNNTITRAQGYKDGVISALSRFIHPEIF